MFFLMHWTQGIWFQEKIDQNYNSYFVVIMWGHLIMGEQVKERLGSLTTMAINHHKACTFRISSKNQCSWSLKKFNVQMSPHDKRYRSEVCACDAPTIRDLTYSLLSFIWWGNGLCRHITNTPRQAPALPLGILLMDHQKRHTPKQSMS